MEGGGQYSGTKLENCRIYLYNLVLRKKILYYFEESGAEPTSFIESLKALLDSVDLQESPVVGNKLTKLSNLLIQSSVLYGVLHSVLPTKPLFNCVIFAGDKHAYMHISKHCRLEYIIRVCGSFLLTLGDAHASTKSILQSHGS